MKINFTILFTLIFSFSFSQSIIFDNINSNGGKINDENINITFTIGQPIVGTISNQSNTISQGFQQNYNVEGCTDENACNFDPSANVENGECTTLHLHKKVSQFVTHTFGMVKHILKVANILTQHQTQLGVTLLFI